MFESIWVTSITEFCYMGTLCKRGTHTHTRIHTVRDRGDDYRQNLQSRFAYLYVKVIGIKQCELCYNQCYNCKSMLVMLQSMLQA